MVFLLLDDDKTTISLLQKTVAGLLPDVRLLTAGSIPEFEAIAQKEDIASPFWKHGSVKHPSWIPH